MNIARDVAVEAGRFVRHIAERAAHAWAHGDEHAAHRWTDLAFRLRGPDVYLEIQPESCEHPEPRP